MVIIHGVGGNTFFNESLKGPAATWRKTEGIEVEEKGKFRKKEIRESEKGHHARCLSERALKTRLCLIRGVDYTAPETGRGGRRVQFLINLGKWKNWRPASSEWAHNHLEK